MSDKWMVPRDFKEKALTVSLEKKWKLQGDDDDDWISDLVCCCFSKEWEFDDFISKLDDLFSKGEVTYKDCWNQFCG